MFQALLKFAAIAALTRMLKPRLRGLLVASTSTLAVFIAHVEYLSYVELTADLTYLSQSYWYKWAVITLIVLLYILTVELRMRKSKPNTNEDLPPVPEKLTERAKDDGFDFIRKNRHPSF